MNLLLQPEAVKPQFIYFSEIKPNALFDGKFAKINYCNDFFTMYGMHISLKGIRFETIQRIETDILNVYMQNNALIKNYKLSNDTKIASYSAIKISGVWENNNGEIGISYKLL